MEWKLEKQIRKRGVQKGRTDYYYISPTGNKYQSWDIAHKKGMNCFCSCKIPATSIRLFGSDIFICGKYSTGAQQKCKYNKTVKNIQK